MHCISCKYVKFCTIYDFFDDRRIYRCFCKESEFFKSDVNPYINGCECWKGIEE